MARYFKLLAMLCLVAACLVVEGSATTTDATTTADQTTTEAPTTADATTTEAPTEAPTTADATTTEAPTEAPTTADPTTTEAPTEATTTADPTTTEAPTDAPATADATTTETPTDAPTTADPTTTEAPTDAPATADATTTEAPTEAPATADPTTTEAPTDAPATADPTTTEAPTDAPATADPTTTEAPTEAPATADATTTEVPTDAPATADATTTEAPTDAPATADATTTEAPTDAPATADATTTEAPTDAPATADATTTEAPTDAPTTADATTTEAPTDASTTADATTTEPQTDATTTAEPTTDPCAGKPCGSGSTCEARFNEFVCICLAGQVYTYETKSCDDAKVFPGTLTLTETYDEILQDRTSERFFSLAERIVDELSQVYRGTADYVTSTVQRFEQKPNRRVWSRNTGNVLAVVEIIFKKAAEITEDTVKETFEKAETEDSVFQPESAFEAQDLCDRKPCDANTTKCTSSDGSFTCDCLDGFENTDNNRKCLKCSFGYSGDNCKDFWKLALVITGSVLGGLLLISIIAFTFLRVRSSKKPRDDTSGTGSNFSSSSPLVSNMGAAKSRQTAANGTANVYANPGIPRIPRARTPSSLDRRTDLEMSPSFRQQNLTPSGRNMRVYEDPDEVSQYSQSRPRSSNAHVRPQTNPYNQNRPQNSNSSSNQGYNNPYFTHDNGRRLY